VRLALRLGVGPPSLTLLDTRGRVSGKPRTTPVGNGLEHDSDTFWLVAEHGRRAGYVRNIDVDQHVRVKLGRTWRTGIANVLPDDDPVARQERLPHLNARAVRGLGTELLTVRIDLDPVTGA
jgi:deazaflavin-dependent oxidoreductase (nitroreductase family)